MLQRLEKTIRDSIATSQTPTFTVSEYRDDEELITENSGEITITLTIKYQY